MSSVNWWITTSFCGRSWATMSDSSHSVGAGAVAALVARVARRHDRDQLQRGQHGPPARLVGLGLPLQSPHGRVRGADPERTQLPVLRVAVVGDDAVAREDRPAAARELW